MNLDKLFQLQKELDKHIEKEHPRHEGEDRLEKKILALQVELGELANEARFFKYWSHDQEPRTKVQVYTGRGRKIEGKYRNPLLEEYVDCLHFILSIGLEIKYNNNPTYIVRTFDVISHFNDMFGAVTDFYKFYRDHGIGCGLYDSYDDLLCIFIGLGKELGFTWEQIEQAYLDKNSENHRRQENGY